MELLPEEALYLVERGVIELWREGETQGEGEDAKVARVPMSVQQAWAELIGHDGLTIERFQVSFVCSRGFVAELRKLTLAAFARKRCLPTSSD